MKPKDLDLDQFTYLMRAWAIKKAKYEALVVQEQARRCTAEADAAEQSVRLYTAQADMQEAILRDYGTENAFPEPEMN
jgi:hypothetical protein